MDQLNSDPVSGLLQEIKELINGFEEGKKTQNELSEFVTLLQEELKLARDAERSTELKKSRCQAFLSQQQEVILNLLHVKEENENLKSTISQLETTVTGIQNNSMADHVKKDAEIKRIRQDYLKELIKIQEESDAQATKIKAELNLTVEELRESLAKKDREIMSLEAEIKDLKDRAAVNVDIFQKKLADQERKYQAELETWKAAELNRSMYQEVQSSGVLQYDARNSYQPGRSTWEHPYQHPTTPTQPFISRVRNVQQRPIQPNIVHPLQAYTDYRSPGRFYLENRNPNVTEEREEDKTEKPSNNPNSSAAGQKPKILVPSKRKKLFHPSMNIL
uniref:Uncharacterized protein n=1 Tax=Homalodisca liturata TaxID=320908 RepID=A0A1B6I4L8_9HEMI